ncbi:AraC family transcriptional regulator [Paraburkholderia sp. BCC1886]|uniref:AraC family transcriptional regulator n=1 Tax=Paraburkholderia sp. BCC1886 TaxID=2562670 RepID=UPI00118399A4|nr:AraC family transcriptional regulator [Paraburkholderia sp. BCC1886]
MQALDQLIRLARIQGMLDLRCLFIGPLDVDHPPEPPGTAAFHVILSGQCSLRRKGGAQVDLAAGDVVVLPRGDAHMISVSGEAAAARMPTTLVNGAVPVRSNLEGGPPSLDLLCGRFAYAPPTPLMDALPDVIQVRFPDQPLEWMVATLRSESEEARAGAESIVTAISTALFTMILRVWLADAPRLGGILALLSHKRIGQAMLAMLGAPGEAWTLARLAEQAAMSRASFMRVYATLATEPPLQLLGTIRMQLAGRLLTESSRKIGDIAAEVGYNSEAAFSKRFKEVFALSPGRYRHERAADDAPDA